MAKLLLNLRDVPDDEADDVRALLDAHGIAWYETRPSPWGVSHGGIWISDADRHAEAKAHLDAYQKRRGDAAREAREADRLAGRLESPWAELRRRPLRALAALVGIALMIALVLLPYLLLRA